MTPALCTRNIRLLYILTVCTNAVFILPIFLPFYRDHLGLGFHDLLIAESVFAAGLILFDVPTGWFADRYGRKLSMLIGSAWYVVCLYMMMTATGLWSAILAQACISLALCMISGANSAFLYDTLLVANRTEDYRKCEGFRFGLQLYACALASITGAFLYTFDYRYPFLLEMALMVVATLSAALMTEPERHKPVVHHHPFKDMKDTITYVLQGHRELGVLIVISTLLFSTTKICMWSLQAYTAELDFPEAWNGWIIAAVMMVGAVSGHFSHRIFPRLSGRHILYAMLGMMIIAMAMAGHLLSPVGLALLGLEGFAYGLAAPRIQADINHMVDSSRRATVLSVANFTTSVGFIPFSQCVGYINDHQGIGHALIFYALLLVVMAGVCVRLIEGRSRTV